MHEYALVTGGQFQETRLYEERPPNIPHKSVQWFPVSRVYGEPFEGVEGDAYVIKTVDPATLPPPVPGEVSRRQLAQALAPADITQNEALAWAGGIALPAALQAAVDGIPDPDAAFDMAMLLRAYTFQRHHQATLVFCSLFNKTSEQADDLWRAAGAL